MESSHSHGQLHSTASHKGAQLTLTPASTLTDPSFDMGDGRSARREAPSPIRHHDSSTRVIDTLIPWRNQRAKHNVRHSLQSILMFFAVALAHASQHEAAG